MSSGRMARAHAYVGFSRRGFPGLGLEVPVTQGMKLGLTMLEPWGPINKIS